MAGRVGAFRPCLKTINERFGVHGQPMIRIGMVYWELSLFSRFNEPGWRMLHSEKASPTAQETPTTSTFAGSWAAPYA